MSCDFYRGNNQVFCNACVPFDFKDKYVDIHYAYLMSVSSNLDSDIEDRDGFLQLARKNLNVKHNQLSFGALARTLHDILEESNAPKLIDFLSLDVEGAELDVLKGIDFGAYSFNYILVECRNLERLEGYLSSNGYYLIDQLSYHDYLFGLKKDFENG